MGNVTDPTNTVPDTTLDDVLSLAEAARVSGLTAHTLAQQAEKGRLRGRKIGRTWVTTRQWLSEYLREHARRPSGSAPPGDGSRRASRPSS